jgi:putative methyltransferase (TIGR04325 family)
VRELARALTPPALWRAGSRLWGGGSSAPAMFSGVFDSFADIEDQQPWIRPSYLAVSKQLLQECRAGQMPPASGTANAVVAFILNTSEARTPRVLDWAGGTALRYWSMRPSFQRQVAWHVVDKPELAALSRDVMGGDSVLHFSETWPEASPRFDVALIYASLQYVEDQAALLRDVAAYRPRFIVLARLMALDGRSYVTRQRVHGFDTPCKVANLDEVTATLESAGFRTVLSIADGLDLSAHFGPDVPQPLRVGFEHLLVCSAADA